MQNIIKTISKAFSSDPSSSEQPKIDPSKQKAIVVFYSRPDENYSVGVIEEGNTKKLAEIIAAAIKAPLMEIEAVKPYPKDYHETTVQAKGELASKFRPEIKPTKDISEYDVIFLGSPVWWGEIAPPLMTWLESVDLKGKTIFPFVTHEGSRFGSTRQNLKELAPGATIGEGLAMYGHEAQKGGEKVKKAVDNWLKKIGFAS